MKKKNSERQQKTNIHIELALLLSLGFLVSSTASISTQMNVAAV